jgi:diguanylate cyclase (GGDEF)-like protein
MIGACFRRRPNDSSILFKIIILVTTLCGIIVLYSFSQLYLGWSNYQQAKELNVLQDLTSPLTIALKNFMFERGRMNVVLSQETPISKENRSFLDERRIIADQSFRTGLSLMAQKYPQEAELLDKEYEQIKRLRIQVDEEALKPLRQRDPLNRILWFTSCTDYINQVSSTLKRISRHLITNGQIAYYQQIIIDSLRFRSMVGSESSLFTAAISGSNTFSSQDYAELLQMRGESKQVWSEMGCGIRVLDSDRISAAWTEVEDQYYRQFRPQQDRLLDLVLKGQLYEGAGNEIAELSVPALNSILILADSALQEIAIENQKNIKKGLASFISGLLQLLAGILTIILIPVYLKNSLLRPLNKLLDLLGDLSIGQTDVVIPFVKRKDEIGKLAIGVELLQDSIEEEQILKQELQAAVVKLEDLAIKDPLTGLYNRRYMIERLHELENRYELNNSLFSVIMCDIDNFKIINDRYGHDCGDFALLKIAELLARTCREEDDLARWGGEEFMILLPDTDRTTAYAFAERIRQEIDASILQYENIDLKITMTFGVAEYEETLGIEGTIKNADRALLQGKAAGRNRVVVI